MNDYEKKYVEEQTNTARVTAIMQEGIAKLKEAHELAKELGVNFELNLPGGSKDYSPEWTEYTDYDASGTWINVEAWLPSNYNC